MAKTKYKNEELIAKAQSGDLEAEEELLIANDKFCWHIAKRYANTNIDLEDLASIARIGLIKSYKKFDLSKNIKFTTFAATCMNNEILMYLRRNAKKDKITFSINQPLATDEGGNELTIQDIYANPEEEFKHEDFDMLKDALKIFNDNAPEKYVKVLHLFYFEGKTQQEVGKELNISQSYASRMKAGAITCLKHIAKTGIYKKPSSEKNQGKFKKGSREEEMKMSKVNRGDLVYIFNNYKELTAKEISELSGLKKGSIDVYRSKINRKEKGWENIVPKISVELKEKFDSYIMEKEKKSAIKEKMINIGKEEFDLDSISAEETLEVARIKTEKKVAKLIKEKVDIEIPEISNDKNILINNKINIVSDDKDGVSALVYGLSELIKSSPKGTISLNINFEVAN